MPEAHTILWLAGAFLACWGVSLVIRGAAGAPARPCAGGAAAPRRTWGLIVLGFGPLLVGAAAILAGVRFFEWTRVDPDAPPTMDYWDAAVLAAIAASVLLLTWAVTGDRSWGRPRCPRCWYDMTGTASLRCPECGHKSGRARDLHKPRRHWRLAAAGLLGFLAATAVWEFPRFQAGGPVALVPTTVLIAGLWQLPDRLIWQDTSAPREDWSLATRLSQRRAWRWQQRWFDRRLRAASADPPSPEALEHVWQFHRDDTGADIEALARWMVRGGGSLPGRTARCVLGRVAVGPFGFIPWSGPPPRTLEARLRPYADDLRDLARAPDPLIGLAALRLLALGRSDAAAIVPLIFENVKGESGQNLLWFGAGVLSALIDVGAGSDALEGCLHALESGTPPERCCALMILYRFPQEPRVRSVVRAHLDDPDPQAAFLAVRALLAIEQQGALPDVIAAIQRCSDPKYRLPMVQFLLLYPFAPVHLVGLATSEADPRVQAQLADWALIAARTGQDVGPLVPALSAWSRSADPAVAKIAGEALTVWKERQGSPTPPPSPPSPP